MILYQIFLIYRKFGLALE